MKIEKGIPIPARRWSWYSQYPLNQLELGDSVFFSKKEIITNHRLHALADYWRKKLGHHYTIRLVKKNGVPIGWRIWRVTEANNGEIIREGSLLEHLEDGSLPIDVNTPMPVAVEPEADLDSVIKEEV